MVSMEGIQLRSCSDVGSQLSHLLSNFGQVHWPVLRFFLGVITESVFQELHRAGIFSSDYFWRTSIWLTQDDPEKGQS